MEAPTTAHIIRAVIHIRADRREDLAALLAAIHHILHLPHIIREPVTTSPAIVTADIMTKTDIARAAVTAAAAVLRLFFSSLLSPE